MTSKRFNLTKRKFHKRNFSDVIEVFIPDLYLDSDSQLSGTVVDSCSEIVNSQINIASNILTILPLSGGLDFASLSSFDDIVPFFIKQNNFTQISSEDFERYILNALGTSFKNFDNDVDFRSYVTDTLVPTIKTNEALEPFSGLSGIDYLTYHLGWFYFLATSSTHTHDPSSIVSDYFVEKLYQGKPLTLVDGINALSEFIWKNQGTLGSYIPTDFLSGTDTYTSGTQSLDNLKTLNSILYSRDLLNRDDTFVADAFEVYSQTEEYLDNRVSNGPFWRLIKAFSYAFADQQNEINELSVLYDLEDCPDYLLPELANLIGWELVGYDPNKWRLQLANAVDIYKKAGTKQSIIAAVNSVFTPGVVDISGNIQELWESYIPFLIEYSLATESIHFKDFSTWTYEKAEQLQVSGYDYSDFNNNIKLAVDKILLTLFEEFPDYFILAGKPFPRDSEDFVFNYRGRHFPIPPYEEIPYYVNCNISGEFLWRLADLLVCFGVPNSFAIQVKNYIDENTISTVDEAYENYSENNGWLFFTLTYQQAPNWQDIIKDPTNKKEEYLPLWNGKSSHYKLNFEAANFDFSKDTFEVDSREVILIANRLADTFSPAHAVKDSSVFLRETDFYTGDDFIAPHLLIEKYEELAHNLSSTTLGNVEDKAINLIASLLEFNGDRYSFSSIVNTALSSTNTITAPRNAVRRRGLHNKLNLGGYYNRSGFNQPSFNEMLIDRQAGVRYKFNTYDYYNNPFLPLNPVKGYAPDYDLLSSVKNLLPRTVERVYLPMASAYDGGGATAAFDFAKIEEVLNEVSGRNCQALLKFYIDQPNYLNIETKEVYKINYGEDGLKTFGLPAFLENQGITKVEYLVPLRDGLEYGLHGYETDLPANSAVSGFSIDYSNELFLSACSALITELGNVYDDDPRIAHIEIGFLGHEGDWSNAFAFDHSIYPFTLPRKPPVKAINLLVEAFDSAFSGTKVSGRYLDTIGNYPENTTRSLPLAPTLLTSLETDIGLNDSNFTTYTVGKPAAYSQNQQDFYNAKDTYETKMRTAEIEPIETRFWNVFRTRGSSLASQDLAASLNVFRPSIISFNDGFIELNRIRTIPQYANPILYQRQLESTIAMGYNFHIENSYLPDLAFSTDSFYVSVSLSNTGVAPFYYRWPVVLTFTDGSTLLNIQTPWDIRTAKSGSKGFFSLIRGSLLKTAFPTTTELTVLLSVQRPANFIQPIQFANAEQILGTPYVSLGSFNYISDIFDYQTSGANPFTLGFVPSSLSFASVEADCSGLNQVIPPVYDRCAVNSSANYYGYDVSATLKPRGYLGLPESRGDIFKLETEAYVDRGQLDPFMAVIHKVADQKVRKKYEQIIEDNPSTYASDLLWKDVVDSLANEEIFCSGLFLSSLEVYENFGLGKKIPKLFDLYTSAFNRHPTTYDPYRDFGSRLYAHAFGTILENSDLEKRGTIAQTYDLYTTDASNPKVLSRSSVYFSGSEANLATYETRIESDPSAIIASSTVLPTTLELVNSSIIDNVDIVHTSGTSDQNHFVLYDLQQVEARSFIYNNSFLRLKAVNGLPRIRFNVPGSDFSDTYDTFRSENFFCPEHEFRLKIRGLAAKEDGSRLVDARLGVWIHTNTENSDQTWHFGNDGKWHLIKTNEITIPKILDDLTHVITFADSDRGGNTFQCLDPNSLLVSNFLSSIGNFSEDEFQDYELYFNTHNKCHIRVPEEYYKHNQQVHRYDQTYVVEIFMIPGYENRDRFILIEDIDLRDETIYDMTRIDVTGTPTGHKKFPLCNIKHVDLNKEDIRSILNYYNSVAGKGRHIGGLGRDSSESSLYNFANGGSRLDFRVNPFNLNNEVDSYTGNFTLLEVSVPESVLFGEYNPGDFGYAPAEEIPTVPLEGELENINFGFWIG